MWFSMPHLPGEFEIPDDWLSEAGIVGFKPKSHAYCSSPAARLVSLTEIEPIPRFVTHPKDFRGFDRPRLVRLLKGFVAGDEIEPTPAIELPARDFCDSPYRYRVCNGFHRFHASIAAGFVMLPVNV